MVKYVWGSAVGDISIITYVVTLFLTWRSTSHVHV